MLPIVCLVLAYILGIIGGLYNYCIAPFCLIICFFCFYKKDKSIIISVIVSFIIGILLSIFRIYSYDNKYLPSKIDMNVKIISDCIEKDKTISYIVKNELGDKFIIYIDKDVDLEYGMKLHVLGELKLPATSRNRRWI